MIMLGLDIVPLAEVIQERIARFRYEHVVAFVAEKAKEKGVGLACARREENMFGFNDLTVPTVEFRHGAPC
jgi:L-amino acid N-acyltransferase YncA